MKKEEIKKAIIGQIKSDIERRKNRKTKDDQWFELMDREANDMLYYAAGRFPEITVGKLVKIFNEIKDETRYYETLLDEIYNA